MQIIRHRYGGEKVAEVYFYIPAGRAGDAVDCGIKLSEWFSREINIDGDRRKCITALLNPRDEYEKYTSVEYKCLKLEIPPKYCYVADRSLYEAGCKNRAAMKLYEESVIPILSYKFGEYGFLRRCHHHCPERTDHRNGQNAQTRRCCMPIHRSYILTTWQNSRKSTVT